MDGGKGNSAFSGLGEGSQETAYIPIRILGRGAFGEAVLYRKCADNSLVVWKEINLQRLGEKERCETQNEIDILAMLNHANIVSYYNHFLDGDTLLIEMEYANGGNLSEKIAAQDKLLDEKVVLWYFYQLISALAHIHEYGILHRDVKTLNIFLTKAGLAKLGDFGISKVLGNSEMAESYVGTPYYMSPELIRGDRYSQPSDVWSMGCVLYELLTLTKVFDATNPLRLAHDIVQCEVEDVDPTYSEEIRTLVSNMLNKEASLRPTADNILKVALIADRASDYDQRIWEMNSATRRAKMTSSSSSADVSPVVTSKSSEVYTWGGGKLTPQNVELFTKGRSALQVSTGKCHFAVVTVEKELFTWANPQGGEIVGQLGHGDTAAYKAPKFVDKFEGILIKQVSCGDEFTICVTDEGSVYACGSDYYGCLGCDNQEGDEVVTPTLIDFFTARPVEEVSCGEAHVIALTQEGEVYTWGCGEYGRLGLHSEDDYATPQRVDTRGRHGIRSVCAGSEGSFLIKTNGRVLACGSNEHNKLGFNSSAKGLNRKEQLSFDIPYKSTFSAVKPLSKYNIVSMAAGKTHTAALDYIGHLIMFGSNQFGQLGLGDCRQHNGVHLIAGTLTGKWITTAACGDDFTVASTKDNQIYSWGSAENGRLGTILSDCRKSSGVPVYALPRPIFGALHVVSDIACHHWNTIVVAEKVLAQKTIRSTSVLSASSKESDRMAELSEEEPFQFKTDFLEDGAYSSRDPTTPSFATESNVPEWLKAELADAEFIPSSHENSANLHLSLSQTGDSDISQQMAPTPQYARSISNQSKGSESHPETIATLQVKVQQLEAENIKLQELVCHQAETIQAQAMTMAHLEDKSKYHQDLMEEIWEVVDLWQHEWSEAMGRPFQPDLGIHGSNNNLLNFKQQSFSGDDISDMSCMTSSSSRQEGIDMQSDKGDRHDNTTESISSCQGNVRGSQTNVIDNVDDNITENNNNGSIERHSNITSGNHGNVTSGSHGNDAVTYHGAGVNTEHIPAVGTKYDNNDADRSDINVDNSHEVLLHWDTIGSPDEIKPWNKSTKADMMMAHLPGKMTLSVKGVTTPEEML